MTRRRGFTLVELMLASAVMVLAVGGALSMFVAVQRMTRTSVTEAELSVRMRELREKLLFHVSPPHDGRIWSGVLSGVNQNNVVEDERKILMNKAYGYDLTHAKAVDQRIELVPVTSGAVRFFGNDGDRYDERWQTRWLAPGGLSWLPPTGFVKAPAPAQGTVFYVVLEASANGISRRERVTVPVFGKAQRTLDGKVFDE